MDTVEPKAKAAEQWCQHVTEFDEITWRYVKIVDADFAKLRGLSLLQLLAAVTSG
jgi:hypothetical protein